MLCGWRCGIAFTRDVAPRSGDQICATLGNAKDWQIANDCVQSKQLCQISTGQCCTPTNGFAGSNENCL